MAQYQATVRWKMDGPDFLRGQFTRLHEWAFDGGVTLTASASPHVVPKPYSSDEPVDPEEAFIASVASCHMLTFLHVASRSKFEVEAYEDEAVGFMTKNEAGALWVSEIVLHPQITWKPGSEPDAAALEKLHHQAHQYCFIANSVKTPIRVEG